MVKHNNKLQKSVLIKNHKTTQILGVHVFTFLCLIGSQRSWTAKMFLLCLLFPFTVLHRVSGKLLVRELQVLLFLGGDSAFLSQHRDAGSTHLWAQALAREQHPELG